MLIDAKLIDARLKKIFKAAAVLPALGLLMTASGMAISADAPAIEEVLNVELKACRALPSR